MKKFFCVVFSLMVAVHPMMCTVFAENNGAASFSAQLSAMIREYDTGDYFSAMTVTIGEPDLVIDGESFPIDDSGSVAYVENGRTMMPVRGIAEAIGADVSFDGGSGTVMLENEETVVAMTIGDDEMEVNGCSIQLHTAPEIRNDRTMLPVRDVAEALDCEVEWKQETQTATFTRAYQTKRIIVNSEKADTRGAVSHFSANGKTVIQFDNIEDAKACVAVNTSKGFIAQPDYIRVVQAMSWGAKKTGGDEYFSQTEYAAGDAVVAVVDTGIDYGHEMFKSRIVNGYDFYYNDGYSEDERGHGTAVASTVLDIAGKNPNIKIMPLKVFGTDKYCSSIAVANAIIYAADNNADVINLSVGGAHYSEFEQEAINYANSKNVAVVAASGNEKLDLTTVDYSPGGLNGVITVSAINKDNTMASFSNYGDGVVDFGAPGVDIKVAKNKGGYTYMDGTSFASPHVAAVYALAKAVHPDEMTDKITQALKSNAENIGSTKYFGAGRICISNLEQHLSEMYYSDVEVTGVSENNAIICGEIGYKGIIPEIIGVKLNNKDVFRTRFKDEGDNKMKFRCNLNGNAGCYLSSETDYEVKIYTDQGGYILNTKAIKFKTKAKTTAPEPVKPDPKPVPPAPEPIESQLKILPENYPAGELVQGTKVNLSGRIKSNCHITDVRSYILDSDKKVVKESGGWTTTSTYVIEKSKLDTGLKFETLSPGKYYLKYYAKDESGNEVSWISNAFYVKAAPASSPDTPSTKAVVLIPDSFENLSIRKGPSTDYPIVGSMNHTVKCNVYTDKTQNGWYYVEYNGIKGYASGNYIYLPSETKSGTVSIPSSWDNLSIRTGPSTNYKIIGSMNHGEKCTVYPDKGKNGWYYVEYKNIFGYASGNCIK